MLTLEAHLEQWAGASPLRAEVARAVAALAAAAAELSAWLDRPFASMDGAVWSPAEHAEQLLLAALGKAPVALACSTLREEPIRLDDAARLAVTIDPLENAANLDAGLPLGTIFSVLPLPDGRPAEPAALLAGHRQLAAGMVVLGPRTHLILTLRQGTHELTLDRAAGTFVLTRPEVRIPAGPSALAFDVAAYGQWDDAVRTYVEDCLAGHADGPIGTLASCWSGSLAADARRILLRGGILLDLEEAPPRAGPARPRLVHQASPLALIVEEAGGAATDGTARLLDLEPSHLSQRVALALGAKPEVARLAAYLSGRVAGIERSPLFGRRGLFRR